MNARIPLSFARSALFAPLEHNGKTVNGEQVAAACYGSWSVSIEYSGTKLSPSHALVWQVVVGLAIKNEQLNEVEVSTRDVLRHLGRKSDTRSKYWLLTLLAELNQCQLKITTPAHSFSGPLLGSVEVLDRGMLRLSLPPDTLPLLSNEYARVRLDDKIGLAQHAMAAWLFDYCATLKPGFCIPLVDLQRMCGNTATIGTFGRTLKAALNVLVTRKAIDGYSIESGVLKLSKAPGKVVLLSGDKQSNFQRRTNYRTAVQHANAARSRITANL